MTNTTECELPRAAAPEEDLLSTTLESAGMPNQPTWVLTQWDADHEVPLVLGVFATFALLQEAAKSYVRPGSYSEDEDELEVSRVMFQDSADMNLSSTGELVIVEPNPTAPIRTGLFVWDSARRREAYAPLKLYWCTTEDGEEDWFILARCERDAVLEHAYAEGYDPAEASAEFITVLPAERQGSKTGWPDAEDLVACGARFVRRDSPRVVEFQGRIFTEGPDLRG